MEVKATMPIIRGTTPVIKYAFKALDTADIAAAYMVLVQDNKAIIVKDLAAATVEDGALYWKLQQADTLALHNGAVRIMLDWRLNDGTRGVGKTVEATVISGAVNGVI